MEGDDGWVDGRMHGGLLAVKVGHVSLLHADSIKSIPIADPLDQPGLSIVYMPMQYQIYVYHHLPILPVGCTRSYRLISSLSVLTVRSQVNCFDH